MRPRAPRLLAQDTRGGVLERLVDPDEAAGQRVAPRMRVAIALQQQDGGPGAGQPQQHQIDGDGGPRVIGGIVARQEGGLGFG